MPELGNDVAQLSRRVFFPLAVLALAIMSDFYWSAYPFDNVCRECCRLLIKKWSVCPCHISHSLKSFYSRR